MPMEGWVRTRLMNGVVGMEWGLFTKDLYKCFGLDACVCTCTWNSNSDSCNRSSNILKILPSLGLQVPELPSAPPRRPGGLARLQHTAGLSDADCVLPVRPGCLPICPSSCAGSQWKPYTCRSSSPWPVRVNTLLKSTNPPWNVSWCLTA